MLFIIATQYSVAPKCLFLIAAMTLFMLSMSLFCDYLFFIRFCFDFLQRVLPFGMHRKYQQKFKSQKIIYVLSCGFYKLKT